MRNNQKLRKCLFELIHGLYHLGKCAAHLNRFRSNPIDVSDLIKTEVSKEITAFFESFASVPTGSTYSATHSFCSILRNNRNWNTSVINIDLVFEWAARPPVQLSVIRNICIVHTFYDIASLCVHYR